ncbi:helix-turn-helix domain-containing protein [Candidatus Pacearchaeota archaeon]|nr:helix-turn-helix domain-containing protein [Candidatus Pacearchaeota archaeon]
MVTPRKKPVTKRKPTAKRKTSAKKKPPVKAKRGRPSPYRATYVEKVAKLIALGAIDTDIAGFFKVSVQTINTWQHKYPEFLAVMKKAKEEADNKVVRSLFERATGYSHPDEKVFCSKDGEILIHETRKHYPPETKALSLWLTNRQSQDWKNRQDVDVKADISSKSVDLTPEMSHDEATKLYHELLGND